VRISESGDKTTTAGLYKGRRIKWEEGSPPVVHIGRPSKIGLMRPENSSWHKWIRGKR